MRRDLCSAALALLPVVAMADVPIFDRIEVPEHVYDGGWEHFVGGGIATFDCDGDALPEMVVAGGQNAAQLFRNITPQPGAQLAFEVQTPEALSLTGVTGAYPIDLDGDGLLDLAMLRVGQDVLLKGLGDCAFAPFEPVLPSGDDWSTAFTATWEDGEIRPTLAIGTYVDRAHPDGPFGQCGSTLLYRPEGDWYGEPVRLEPGYCALSALFTDWNRNGRADLRVSNDRHYFLRDGGEQLWAMEAVPRLYGEAEGWVPYSLWGMGIASRDLNGDGFPEVYLTSMGDQRLQFFDGTKDAPVWSDAPFQIGSAAHRPHAGGDGRPSTGWHAAFGDIDNDGIEDIFVAKGNVEQMPDAAMDDPNSLLLGQEDGSFREVSVEAGVASMERGRGAVLGDLNADGWLDIAVVNRRAPMEVYQNTGRGEDWLTVELEGPRGNSQAIGAFIELRDDNGTRMREVTLGGGHASGDALPHHFGLGAVDKIELRVIWPDGTASDWLSVNAGNRIRIVY